MRRRASYRKRPRGRQHHLRRRGRSERSRGRSGVTVIATDFDRTDMVRVGASQAARRPTEQLRRDRVWQARHGGLAAPMAITRHPRARSAGGRRSRSTRGWPRAPTIIAAGRCRVPGGAGHVGRECAGSAGARSPAGRGPGPRAQDQDSGAGAHKQEPGHSGGSGNARTKLRERRNGRAPELWNSPPGCSRGKTA